MDETHVRTNSWRAWLLAARPKTLSGAAVPVLIGTALALSQSDGDIRWLPCVLCFLFAFVMQIDANFVNDYFDFKKGNDDVATRLGPPRACTMGWITPEAMKRALVATTCLGCVIGLPLAWIGGWSMVGIGALCVLFCFLYTTKLSYLGLGDVLVLVFFGIVPVCLTHFLCMPEHTRGFSWIALGGSLACGLVIDTLLLVNNNRDIDNDRRDGKNTLVVRIGARRGRLLYGWVGVVAVLVNGIYLCQGSLWAFLLPLIIYLPLHLLTTRKMMHSEGGKALNGILGETARNMAVYGLSTALGLLLSMW